jgi:hypothetical protein
MNTGAVLIIYCGEKNSTAMAVAAIAAPTALRESINLFLAC